MLSKHWFIPCVQIWLDLCRRTVICPPPSLVVVLVLACLVWLVVFHWSVMVDSASDVSLQSDGDCELEVRSDAGSDADSRPPGLISSGSSSQGDHDDEGVELEVLFGSLGCARQ